MPSGAVMYDKNGKPLFEFGKDHKNKIIWSPNQRFVMICGFGNLDGSIHVWDAVTRKIISSTKYKSASLCTWSPCGRYYVCAKVTPRMNVDNQYSVKYNCKYLGFQLSWRGDCVFEIWRII